MESNSSLLLTSTSSTMDTQPDKVVFRRKTIKIGESVGLIIPRDLVRQLNIEPSQEVNIMTDKGKHGIYLAVWSDDQ
jgi:hypothetical protein